MGESKRKGRLGAATEWPRAHNYEGVIDLHRLPPSRKVNGARIRELIGDSAISDDTPILLNAFRIVAGDRSFHAGFCLGNDVGFSAIGIAVIDRLMLEEPPGARLHVAPIVHADIAWDMVMRHLRTFTGGALLFAFPDSDVYDAGTAEMFYSDAVRLLDEKGAQITKLTTAQRVKIREQAATLAGRPPPPMFYPAVGVEQDDTPWIFHMTTPAGKKIRTAVWNGRRNYIHEFPEDIVRWVGGDRIAIVQVDSPVGVNRRSSFDLTHRFSGDFDGIIHWARDTETFQSIVTSFVRLDVESVSPPDLPEVWEPEITVFTTNADAD